MVDVRVREARQPIRNEINGLLECPLLLNAIMPPECCELGLAAVGMDEAEQIFEPSIEEGIAFHIKEEIAFTGARQPTKALADGHIQQFVVVLAVGAFRGLETGLAPQALQRVRLESGDPRRYISVWDS